ncbi:MAG: hypothetical protein J6S67_21035 [Methanobrevibacter sp.]|nr:hypothetical protein [Methanobrevibacter sp.]
MSYIVKNCPAITNNLTCRQAIYENMFCDYRTDCVIKRIITICKRYKMSKEDMKKSKEFADIIRGSKYGSDALAIQILQLLDIEEVK